MVKTGNQYILFPGFCNCEENGADVHRIPKSSLQCVLDDGTSICVFASNRQWRGTRHGALGASACYILWR